MKEKLIKTQLNAHFIFNSLNAIEHYITINEKELSLKYLSMFGKLVRFHLENMDKPEVNLREELEMLTLYLKLQKLRYEKKLLYEFKVEDELFDSDHLIPRNFIGALIENILEMEVMKQSIPVWLNIDVKQLGNGIQVTLQYNTQVGKGRRISESYRKNFPHWEEQVELINSKKRRNFKGDSGIEFKSSIKIPFSNVVLFIPFQDIHDQTELS